MASALSNLRRFHQVAIGYLLLVLLLMLLICCSRTEVSNGAEIVFNSGILEISLRIFTAPTYPMERPVFEIVDPHNRLSKTACESLVTEFEQQWQLSSGSESLFPLIEAFRTKLPDPNDSHLEKLEKIPEKLEHNEKDLETVVQQLLLSNEDDIIEIFSGEPLEDRRSVFQAHVASVYSLSDVQHMLNQLKRDRKIARATHNIVAYRFIDSRTGALNQDNDDDGETAAGGRLSHLLEILGVQNVIVVVSRWYGGIQLGAGMLYQFVRKEGTRQTKWFFFFFFFFFLLCMTMLRSIQTH